MEWSNAPIQFASPVSFADNSTLAGMRAGTVTPVTRAVPPRSTVVESFAVPGLLAAKHAVTLNPASRTAPPAGIVWNAYIEADGVLKLRLTNVTDAALSLDPSPWSYSAPQRG